MNLEVCNLESGGTKHSSQLVRIIKFLTYRPVLLHGIPQATAGGR